MVTILPVEEPVDKESSDSLYSMHRRLLYLGFLYLHLRNAIEMEDGVRIIRSWQYWLPLFLGSGRRNYATEAANFLCNLKADWSTSTAFIATHNRTVNMSGITGRGKPLDQEIELYNL